MVEYTGVAEMADHAEMGIGRLIEVVEAWSLRGVGA